MKTDENVSDLASSVSSTISEATTQIKDKASDLGRSAVEKIDQNRSAVASGLESASSTLHQKAASMPGGETVANLAHSTADKLSSTADYVREHSANSMMYELKLLVRNNPGVALLAAAVVGFFVGRTLTSED